MLFSVIIIWIIIKQCFIVYHILSYTLNVIFMYFSYTFAVHILSHLCLIFSCDLSHTFYLQLFHVHHHRRRSLISIEGGNERWKHKCLRPQCAIFHIMSFCFFIIPLLFFSCRHESDWWASRFRCRNVYQNKRIWTATQRAFRLHFNLGRHDSVIGYELQSHLICIEAKINRPASQRQNSRKCVSGKNFSLTVSTPSDI